MNGEKRMKKVNKITGRLTLTVIAAAFVIELDPLKGREKIESTGVKVVSMLNYDLD